VIEMSNVVTMPGGKKPVIGNTAPKRFKVFLGGKLRTLQLDFNAIDLIQERTGRDLLKGEFIPKSVADLRLFLWAGLQTAAEGDPENGIAPEGPISEEEVGAGIYIHQFQEALHLMMNLVRGYEDEPNSLAPFVSTDQLVIEVALAKAKLNPGELLVDLGAGDGRVLAVAGDRYRARVRGVEMNKDRARVARALLKAMELSARGEVVEGLIQDAKIDDADVVFVYLLTASNAKIAAKLSSEMKPGARVVSHDFAFPGWVQADSATVEAGERQHLVFVYEIGKHLPDGTSAPPEEEIPEDVVMQYASSLADSIKLTISAGLPPEGDLPD